MYLPEMREKATHRCKNCKFFVAIKGRTETKSGCIVHIKAYGSHEKRVPAVLPIMDVLKRVGLEGLAQALQFSDPEAQSCGKFERKATLAYRS